MPKYRVVYTVDASTTIEVEAANKTEARDKAWRGMASPRLCHQCASDLDLGDPIKIIDVVRLDDKTRKPRFFSS